MNLAISAFGLFVMGAAFAADAPPRAIQVAEPPEHAAAAPDAVVSWSKQFRIAGGDALLRGTVAMMAEQTKTELLKLTGEKDDWKIPVNIRLYGKQGDPLPPHTVLLRRLEVAGINELKVDIHLSRGIENEPFKRAITAALLYERTLHQNPAAGVEQPLVVPPWLSDGLREATAWSLNQSDRNLYEAVFKSGLFKIEGLFATDEDEFADLDAATRAAFRISSGALVMALLEQPQGKEGFRAFLTEVSSFEGEMPSLLRKHFPEMNLSETSLSKWWALQLANKGGTNVLTDTLSIQKTESNLAAALQLHFRTSEGILRQKPLESWPELAALEEPERIAAVRMAEDALVHLSNRCFPSYRPILKDYQQVLAAIAKNKTHDVAANLTKLKEVRTTMITRATRGRDYLDWFEITRARQTSGEFNDYLKLKERLKSDPHQRKDPVSTYLDRMDKIFHRDEKKSPFALPR